MSVQRPAEKLHKLAMGTKMAGICACFAALKSDFGEYFLRVKKSVIFNSGREVRCTRGAVNSLLQLYMQESRKKLRLGVHDFMELNRMISARVLFILLTLLIR